MVRRTLTIARLKPAVMKESSLVSGNASSINIERHFCVERKLKMRRTTDFVLRKIYGKNILMPIRKNEIGDAPIVLNEVAGVIWDLLVNDITKQQLVSKVCNMYKLKEGSDEQKTIEAFVGQLIDLKLIIK